MSADMGHQLRRSVHAAAGPEATASRRRCPVPRQKG